MSRSEKFFYCIGVSPSPPSVCVGPLRAAPVARADTMLAGYVSPLGGNATWALNIFEVQACNMNIINYKEYMLLEVVV